MRDERTRRGDASAILLLLLGGLLVSGCGSAEPDEAAEATPSPTMTPAPFNPTITPVPSPTELPPVTPPTEAPTATVTPTPTRNPTIANVVMSPNIGDLGERVTISAVGYVPESEARLYWVRPGQSPQGSPFRTVDVDEEGGFEVALTIPSDWPGGAPGEHEFLELRVLGEEDREAWASFAYVPLFEPFVAPGGTYTNATYGYAVDLPPEWVADESNPANVTFGPEGESHASFIRVVQEADLSAAIDGMMNEVASGLTFDEETGLLGALDGTRVEVEDGRVYWFVQDGGQTYILHFEHADAEVAGFTYSTFRFT